MSDIRDLINEVPSNALLRSNTLTPTDELALLTQLTKALDKREGDIKQLVLADRESHVGTSYYVSVTERAGLISWKTVAEALTKLLLSGTLEACDAFGDSDYEALKAKHTGKLSQIVGVDPLPDIDLLREALENGFGVLDFETTGLSLNRDNPVSVGFVAMRRDRLAGGHGGEGFYSIVNPKQPIAAAAYAIHGISDADAAAGVSLEDMADKVVNAMAGVTSRILVGQNRFSFDLPILRRFLRKGADEGWRYLDTQVLSKVLWPGESASADSISARLGMAPRTGHHNAHDDALMTASHFTAIASMILHRDEA